MAHKKLNRGGPGTPQGKILVRTLLVLEPDSSLISFAGSDSTLASSSMFTAMGILAVTYRDRGEAIILNIFVKGSGLLEGGY